MSRIAESAKSVRRAECPKEATFVELLRTADLLSRGLLQVLKTEAVSAAQYNVLRILRGAPARTKPTRFRDECWVFPSVRRPLFYHTET